MHSPRVTEDSIIERSASAPAAAWPGFFARRGRAIVVGLAVLYAASFATVSILKYRFYLYDDFDLAIFVQALNGILEGTLFSSIRGIPWLGDHASLVLFPLAPLYALARHPVTLLLLQSAALALGALPVSWLARRELGDPRAAVAFAALYLLHPALGYLNLYEFHPETLSVPLLLAAFHFMRGGRLVPMTIAAALALLGREDVALVVAAMGVVALATLRRRRWAFATALLASAGLSLALSFGVLRPAFGAGAADLSLLYRDWGGSPAEIAATLAHHPLRALEALVATPGDALDTALKRAYYPRMLAPLFFLPLLSPWTLLIPMPILFEHFLASPEAQHGITYQYTALVTPFLVVAAVLGAGNLKRLATRLGAARAPGAHAAERVTRLVPALALLAALGANLAYGALLGRAAPSGEVSQAVWPAPMDRTLRPYRDRLLAGLPARGGAVASFGFLARLAGRSELHSVHHVLAGHLTLSSRPTPPVRGAGGMIAEFDPERTLASVDPGTGQRLRDLIAAHGWRAAESAGNIVLYRADPQGDSLETWAAGAFLVASPRALTFERTLGFLGSELPLGVARPGGILVVRTFWRRAGSPEGVFIAAWILLGPRDTPVHQTTAFLGSLVNPVHLWPLGGRVRTTDRIVLPAELAPGRYTLALRLGVLVAGRTLLARCDDPALATDRMLVRLGMIEVETLRH